MCNDHVGHICIMCRAKYVCSICSWKHFKNDEPGKQLCPECYERKQKGKKMKDNEKNTKRSGLEIQVAEKNSIIEIDTVAEKNSIIEIDTVAEKNSIIETLNTASNCLSQRLGSCFNENSSFTIPLTQNSDVSPGIGCMLSSSQGGDDSSVEDNKNMKKKSTLVAKENSGSVVSSFSESNRKHNYKNVAEKNSIVEIPDTAIIEISDASSNGLSLEPKSSQNSLSQSFGASLTENASTPNPLTQDSDASHGNTRLLTSSQGEDSSSVATFLVGNSQIQMLNSELPTSVFSPSLLSSEIASNATNNKLFSTANSHEKRSNGSERIANFVLNTSNVSYSSIVNSQNLMGIQSQLSTAASTLCNTDAAEDSIDEEDQSRETWHKVKLRLSEILDEPDDAKFVVKYYKSKFYLLEHKLWDLTLKNNFRVNILKNQYACVLGRKRYLERLTIDHIGIADCKILGLKDRFKVITKFIKETKNKVFFSSKPLEPKKWNKFCREQAKNWDATLGIKCEAKDSEFLGEEMINVTGKDETDWSDFFYRKDKSSKKRKNRSDKGKVRGKRVKVAATPDWRKRKPSANSCDDNV